MSRAVGDITFPHAAHRAAATGKPYRVTRTRRKRCGASARFTTSHTSTVFTPGVGLRKDKNPINDWPQRCAEWLGSVGLLGGK